MGMVEHGQRQLPVYRLRPRTAYKAISFGIVLHLSWTERISGDCDWIKIHFTSGVVPSRGNASTASEDNFCNSPTDVVAPVPLV